MPTWNEDATSWRIANSSNTQAEILLKMRTISEANEMDIFPEDLDVNPENMQDDRENWSVVTGPS